MSENFAEQFGFKDELDKAAKIKELQDQKEDDAAKAKAFSEENAAKQKLTREKDNSIERLEQTYNTLITNTESLNRVIEGYESALQENNSPFRKTLSATAATGNVTTLGSLKDKMELAYTQLVTTKDIHEQISEPLLRVANALKAGEKPQFSDLRTLKGFEKIDLNKEGVIDAKALYSLLKETNQMIDGIDFQTPTETYTTETYSHNRRETRTRYGKYMMNLGKETVSVPVYDYHTTEKEVETGKLIFMDMSPVPYMRLKEIFKRLKICILMKCLLA